MVRKLTWLAVFLITASGASAESPHYFYGGQRRELAPRPGEVLLRLPQMSSTEQVRGLLDRAKLSGMSVRPLRSDMYLAASSAPQIAAFDAGFRGLVASLRGTAGYATRRYIGKYFGHITPLPAIAVKVDDGFTLEDVLPREIFAVVSSIKGPGWRGLTNMYAITVAATSGDEVLDVASQLSQLRNVEYSEPEFFGVGRARSKSQRSRLPEPMGTQQYRSTGRAGRSRHRGTCGLGCNHGGPFHHYRRSWKRGRCPLRHQSGPRC